MNWTLLGIEPTQDKKAIAAAYRTQLMHTNPEDSSEAFKALRAAYEEALKLAECPAEERNCDETPVGRWMQQIRALYDDFACRIQPEKWEELLAGEICTALDTRPLAETALLNFLTECFYLPQSVWQTLDRTFFWTERKDELYESYARDFVDYAVLSGIRDPENLPYGMFVPGVNGKDCDEYRRLYYQAGRCAPAELPQLIEQMNRLSERHPYGELLACRLLLENGETQRGLEGCRRLAEEYPQDARLQLEWAVQCMNNSAWAEGEAGARRVLELAPDSQQARQVLAVCLAQQGQYEDAKKLVFQLMDAAGGNRKRGYELHQMIQTWNEALIQQLEAQLQTETENTSLRVRLAWCYLQNERPDEALQLCRGIEPGCEDEYDYCNLCAKAHYALEEYDKALSHLQAVEKILREMVPDGTEQTASRISALPEKLQMQGECLFHMGRTGEAMQKYEQALALAPENPEILTEMGNLLRSVRELDRAAGIFEKLTDVLPESYHGYYLLALTRFEQGRDRDAFEAINRALELEGSALELYVLRMRILLRNGAWEGVRSTLDFLRQHGVTDEINTVWCEAQLLEQGEDGKAQALELYRALATRVENGEALEEASALYYRLLCLEAEHLDAGKREDREKMLALAEKGLSYDENDFPCLDYKAWLLKRDGRREESLAIYRRLEAVPRRSMSVEAELAELYYQDLDCDADKALHYYELLLAQEERPAYLFYAGTCCKYLERYDEAERYFLRLQEIRPESVDGYNGMSYLYDTLKRYEDSLTQIDKVIELVRDWEGDQSSYYYHKLRVLRRLNRPADAVAVLDELSEKYGGKDVFQNKFEVLCQFGMWEQAAELLKDWRKSGTAKKRMAAAAIDLQLFCGKIDEARSALETSAAKLNGGDAERLTLLLGELDGDEAVQMPIWEKRVTGRQDTTHELMNMAQVQWWNGHYEKAREYAQAALVQLEELIPVRKKFEALYRSRRSLVLAILGRFEEAEAELAAVRGLPLCEICSYCSCKDADIFEANIEEIRGNWARALELHRAGAERWHDDMDFVSGARRMMRKGL